MPAAAIGDQEQRMMADFAKRFDIHFNDPSLLKLALTHRSYLHVTGQGPRESNERLEFLGDSVLGLVTSEFLYRSHPSEHEGQLTKTKSLLVSKAILSRRALAMGLGQHVFMSHSEVESGGRQRLSILADAFESVIGAVYLDQGFEAARSFIHRWLLSGSRDIVADKRHTNYKSHLQEYVQSTFRTHPVYRIRSEMGPDHSKQFMVEVMVGRRVLGEGRGRNKKEAEQAAARNALEAVESGPVSDRETRRSERGPRAGEPARAEAAPRAAAPARPAEAGPVAEAETDDHDEDAGDGRRRRRRGRRGGRGRGHRPDAPQGAEAGTHAPEAESRPAAPERGESRVEGRERGEARERGDRSHMTPERGEMAESSRFTRPTPPPMVSRGPEMEPIPAAGEEDENEEVGRPEGPADASSTGTPVWAPLPSHVPPPPVPSRPARAERPPRREPEPPAPAASEPEPEQEPEPPVRTYDQPEIAEPAMTDALEEAARDAEDDAGPRYPEVTPPPAPPAQPTTPPPPAFGRRTRRGR
jgi:ribonuclease III